MEDLQYFPQWMLKNIQIKLIHILGGYTKEEYVLSYIDWYRKGYNNGFNNGIKQVAEELNNVSTQNYSYSKQDLIDKIYSKIQEALERNVKQEDCL